MKPSRAAVASEVNVTVSCEPPDVRVSVLRDGEPLKRPTRGALTDDPSYISTQSYPSSVANDRNCTVIRPLAEMTHVSKALFAYCPRPSEIVSLPPLPRFSSTVPVRVPAEGALEVELQSLDEPSKAIPFRAVNAPEAH